MKYWWNIQYNYLYLVPRIQQPILKSTNPNFHNLLAKSSLLLIVYFLKSFKKAIHSFVIGCWILWARYLKSFSQFHQHFLGKDHHFHNQRATTKVVSNYGGIEPKLVRVQGPEHNREHFGLQFQKRLRARGKCQSICYCLNRFLKKEITQWNHINLCVT